MVLQYVEVAVTLLLVLLGFRNVIFVRTFRKSGRTTLLWITLYIFFLFVLHLSYLLGLLLEWKLWVLSGIASVIILISLMSHCFFNRKFDKPDDLF